MADERTLLLKAQKALEIEKPNAIEEIRKVKDIIVAAMIKLKEKVANKGIDFNVKYVVVNLTNYNNNLYISNMDNTEDTKIEFLLYLTHPLYTYISYLNVVSV